MLVPCGAGCSGVLRWWSWLSSCSSLRAGRTTAPATTRAAPTTLSRPTSPPFSVSPTPAAGRGRPGTPGDRATGAYLAERLKKAGYRVTVDPFTVPFYEERRPPQVEIDGKPLRAIRTLQFSPSACRRADPRRGPRLFGARLLRLPARRDCPDQARRLLLLPEGRVRARRPARWRADGQRRAEAHARLAVPVRPRDPRGRPGRDTGAGLGHRALIDVQASRGGADEQCDRRDRARGRHPRGHGRRSSRLRAGRAGPERRRQRGGRAVDDGGTAPRRAGCPRAPRCGSGSGAARSSACSARATTSTGSSAASGAGLPPT